MTKKDKEEPERLAGADKHPPPPPYDPDRELITYLERGLRDGKKDAARIRSRKKDCEVL